MNITFKNSINGIRRFQQGGPMEAPVEEPMEQGAPMGPEEEMSAEEGGEQDPMMQLAQIFAQGLQAQDCNALAQGAEMFLQLIQQMQGGAEAAPQEEPVFRKGGKLAFRLQK